MSKEIERKFLVNDMSFLADASTSYYICQAYLSVNPEATVRVRIAADRAFITVKGRNRGAVRDEWEYPLPLHDAQEMLERCCGGHRVQKRRYIVPFDGHMWEVDVFEGHLDGLVVAEIELEDENTGFALPGFVGREITGDTRYYNSSLSDPSAPLPPVR